MNTQQRIKELEASLEAHKCTYEAHKEQLEALKAELAQEEEVRPKELDHYWSVQMNGDIQRSKWGVNNMTNWKLSTGNCHRTEEEARAYKDWITSPRTQARRLVEMCDGFDVNGTYVWKIDCYGKLIMDEISRRWFSGGLSFTTRQQAQACIDKLGEDVIKCALGVVD